MIDPDRYTFTGEEFLDRFDRLQAARNTVEEALERGREEQVQYYMDELEAAHAAMDRFVGEEYMKFPIETMETNEHGAVSTAVHVMETAAESYEGLVTALEEIDGRLSDRDPTMDYADVPAPIAMVDYSTELIDAWYALQDTYDRLDG